MMPLATELYFGNPVFLAIGTICTWIVVFFPFGVICAHIARQDAFNGLEAFLIGQCTGPVGIWLILKANRKAERNAVAAAMVVDYVRTAPEPMPTETPEQIQEFNRKHGAPRPHEMPGGQAFRPPHEPGHTEQSTPAQMDTLNAPPPPEPPPIEKAPLEPEEIKVKGASAFRPPLKPGRKPIRKTVEMDRFSLPEDVVKPGNGAPQDD